VHSRSGFLLLFVCSSCSISLLLLANRFLQLRAVLFVSLLELLGTDKQLLGLTEYLAFDVELVAMNREFAIFRAFDDKTKLLHVGFDFIHCGVDIVDIVCLAECSQVGALLVDTSLHLEDVEECLSADLCGVRTKKDV